MSNSLRHHGLQHARLFCPPLSPGVCSNSCPLSQWCYLTISSSATSSCCLQSYPAPGYFPMNWLFALGNQNAETSALALAFPKNIQGWFPLGLTGLIAWQSKGLSIVQHHNSKASVLRCSVFFMFQLSQPYWKNHYFDYMDLIYN